MKEFLEALPENNDHIKTFHWNKSAYLYPDFELKDLAKQLCSCKMDDFLIAQESVVYLVRTLVFLGKIKAEFILDDDIYEIDSKGKCEPEFFNKTSVFDEFLDILIGI